MNIKEWAVLSIACLACAELGSYWMFAPEVRMDATVVALRYLLLMFVPLLVFFIGAMEQVCVKGGELNDKSH